MADHFEKAKDDILKRTMKNGGPTPLDLLDALQGLAKDEDQHHDEVVSVTSVLTTQAIGHERRLVEVEAWKKDASENCADRLKKLISEEHEALCDNHVATFHEVIPIHEARRSEDASEENHIGQRRFKALLAPVDRKVWVMWGVFIFIVVEASHGLIMYLIERAAGH